MSQSKAVWSVLLLSVACVSTSPAPLPPLARPMARTSFTEEVSAHATSQPRAATSESRAQPLPPLAADETQAATQQTDSLGANAVSDDSARYEDVVSEQGQRAHGLYFTALTARRLGAKGIAHAVRSASLDAAVIDIKDQNGRVSYDTHVAILESERTTTIRDLPSLLRELKQLGVYSIARVVCFSDPVLPRVHPELSVMDARPERAHEIWNQRHTNTWLDPYNRQNHAWVVALAVEAEQLGFDEVQLDYIRFPVDEGTKFARFPAQNAQARSEVLLDLLRDIDLALHIPLGVDVFGVAALKHGDPEGLGQSLEDWAKYVEVFSPMLYVHGMPTWMRNKTEGRAGLLIELSVHTLRNRIGPTPVIRPFMQAFAARADYFNEAFITEQVRGARQGGGDGFLFWNPGSSYALVRSAMATGAASPLPFAIDERSAARRMAWGIPTIALRASTEQLATASDR
jgi:hypothetical protein